MAEDTFKKISNDEEITIAFDEMTVPIKNSEVTVREEMEEDGKYIIFNAENEFILVTNHTGKFILDKCTGEKNVAQIIKEIEIEYTCKDEIDLPAIVNEYILTLLKAKLIAIKA